MATAFVGRNTPNVHRSQDTAVPSIEFRRSCSSFLSVQSPNPKPRDFTEQSFSSAPPSATLAPVNLLSTGTRLVPSQRPGLLWSPAWSRFSLETQGHPEIALLFRIFQWGLL